MPFHPVRSVCYALLFSVSCVLFGMTCYRVSYTEKKSKSDFLSPRTHYYDAIIVELLVTSLFTILWCLWILSILIGRIGRGSLTNYGTEMIGLLILWVMFIVGAGITTHKWSNLKYCRGHFRPCRILETIKAMAWLCWGFMSLCILGSLWNMKSNGQDFTGPSHGRGNFRGTYPETHPETRTTTDARPVSAV